MTDNMQPNDNAPTAQTRELSAGELEAIRINAVYDETFVRLQDRLDELQARRASALTTRGAEAFDPFIRKTERALENHPSMTIQSLLAHAEAVTRQRDDARAALRPFAEVWNFYGQHLDHYESVVHALHIRGDRDGYYMDAAFEQAAAALGGDDGNDGSAGA